MHTLDNAQVADADFESKRNRGRNFTPYLAPNERTNEHKVVR